MDGMAQLVRRVGHLCRLETDLLFMLKRYPGYRLVMERKIKSKRFSFLYVPTVRYTHVLMHALLMNIDELETDTRKIKSIRFRYIEKKRRSFRHVKPFDVTSSSE